MIDPVDESDEGDGERGIIGFPLPPLMECPIAFLGYYKNCVVFGMPEGEIREEKASEIGRLLSVDIFNSREGQRFLGYWRGAEDKLRRDQATTWFVRQCRAAGYWDRSRPQRGLGVWRGENGDVVLHRGQELLIYPAIAGEPVRRMTIAAALRVPNSPIYAIKAAAPMPAPAATAANGEWLRDALDAWHWDVIGDDGLSGADLVAGWIMAGMLGEVAPFRPHLLIYALMGLGKTKLVELIHAAQSSLAGDVLNSFTRAGLANDLGGMARPVIIDEAEAQPTSFVGVGPVEEALELIRRMATGGGAVKKMGTVGGSSVTQTAVGSVLMAAINPVKLGPADASRIAEAKLLPLEARPLPGSTYHAHTDSEVEQMIVKARELAPAFLGRALENAHRYLADVALLKVAFRDQGSNARSADLAASLAAGRRLLISDAPLSAAEAAQEAMFWRGMLESREAADLVANPGSDCLAHLMGWPSGQRLHDRIVTLGELVARWARGSEPGSSEDISDIEAVLREHGLRLERRPDDEKVLRPWLLVAHNAPALNRVFQNTAWRDWRRTLSYLDNLGPQFRTRPGGKHRFSIGVQARSIAIPLKPWLGREILQGVPASSHGRR